MMSGEDEGLRSAASRFGDDMYALHALEMANTEFERRLRRVTAADWGKVTPCDAWGVRELVNHVIGGNRRYAMLLRGASSAEVDATRSVDHLGHDPVAAFASTASELRSVFDEDGAYARIAHHPAGDRTGAELVEMRVLDISLHAWDLGQAIVADGRLNLKLVEFALTCATHIERLRPHGYFAPPRPDLPPDSSPQDILLHLAGRQPSPAGEVPRTGRDSAPERWPR